MTGNMKTLFAFLVLLCGAYSMSAQSAADEFRRRYGGNSGYRQESVITNYNGVQMLKSDYERYKTRMDKAVSEYAKTASPFFKFDDDERVFYLGKMLYQSEALLPKDAFSSDAKVRLFVSSYKVLDVTGDGCRIDPHPNGSGDSDTDVFVGGMVGHSGRIYEPYLVAKLSGSYEYKTVNGGKRVIPKYKLPLDATKEEYLAYVSKTLQRGVAKTNVIKLTIDEPEQVSKETLEKEATAIEKVKSETATTTKTNKTVIIK